MARFDLEFLRACGVPEEQAEAVLAEHEAALSEALADMVPRAEAKRQMDEALEEALAGVAPEAVARLEAERDMLRAIGGEDFAGVKPKFREQVYALLEKGEGAKPLAEQLEELRGKFEEYFISGQRAQRMPRFGGPTRGSMPRGDMSAAEQFSQAWGFGPGRNG